MVQLWVNLPAKDNMRPAAYQGITADQIPTVAIDGGKARIIAGELDGAKGPAHTFSPINLWDLRLESDTDIGLALPEGHNAMIAVLTGHITVDRSEEHTSELQSLMRNPYAGSCSNT